MPLIPTAMLTGTRSEAKFSGEQELTNVDLMDSSESTHEGHKESSVNTERLRFGKWATEQLVFTFTNRTFTWTSGKHGRIFCVCLVHWTLRSSVGRPPLSGFSTGTSWGVPACVAWSPQTLRGRPLPEDQECEKTGVWGEKENQP